MTKNSSDSDSSTRSQAIEKAGYLFIGTNFLLGIFNIAIGLLSGSIAITSDAVHSFIDSVSGFFIIICEKLSSHQKFSSYRRKIERLTTILIAVIIIIAGIDIIAESIEKIIAPEPPDYSIPVIIILIVSIIIKYVLARYLKLASIKQNSTVLRASSAETMNDTWISVAVLGSALFYLITNIDIEAYISIAIATIIIKVGLEFIFPNISHHHHHHFDGPNHQH